MFGLSYIERPVLGDHLKAHKFGFCAFHEKCCAFCEKRIKSARKAHAFRKTTCKEL